MRRFIITGILCVGAIGFSATSLRAQYPGQGFGQGYGQGLGFGPGGFQQPNFYNRQTQPLSPYLNLLRGGNPAVNWFYGARPGLPAGGYGMPFGISPGALGRQTFFPQVDTLTDAEEAKPGDGLRPTGHPFAFNNQLGYFGMGGGMGMGGQRNQGQPLAKKSSSMGGR